MGISTGMKIGMASGFMARREKIEEQEKEQTDDFREATKAAKKRAQGILAKQKATREEDILTGQGLIQSQEVAPLMKNLKVSDDLLAAIGLEQKVLERQGFTAKEIAKDLSNKIVDIATRMDEQKQKKLQDAQRQEAEVEKSKNTPRNFANIVSEAFSGSARGEAARDLIKQSITPEEQKVIDSDFTTEERKASLGLTPERTISPIQRERRYKLESARLADSEKIKSENQNNAIELLQVIITTPKESLTEEEMSNSSETIFQIQEKGIELNTENVQKLTADIAKRGVKPVLIEIMSMEHSLQTKESTGEKSSEGSKEDKKETTDIDSSFNPSILTQENVVRSISKDEKIYKDPDTGVNYRVKRNSTMDVIGAKKI